MKFIEYLCHRISQLRVMGRRIKQVDRRRFRQGEAVTGAAYRLEYESRERTEFFAQAVNMIIDGPLHRILQRPDLVQQLSAREGTSLVAVHKIQKRIFLGQKLEGNLTVCHSKVAFIQFELHRRFLFSTDKSMDVL